jgi:hypothetical protein
MTNQTRNTTVNAQIIHTRPFDRIAPLMLIACLLSVALPVGAANFFTDDQVRPRQVPGLADDSVAPPTSLGPVEILVDSSGLRHIVADTRIDAAWGEGCVDTDAAWAAGRLHLLLTSGRGDELPDALLQDKSLGYIGSSIPRFLLWDSDGNVLLDQDARSPTMADLHKTLLFLHVPQNAQRELDGLDAKARAVLEAYVEGFNECFHRDEARWLDVYPVMRKYGLDRMDLTPIEVLSRLNYFWAWGQLLEIESVIERIATGDAVKPSALELPAIDYEGSSNEWFISARHMADGRTVHATDPHIPLALSGTYGITFRSVVGRFAGAGLIGAPGMLIGSTTNERGNVAWTTTASGPDGSDLYDVQTSADGSTYLTSDGGAEPFMLESYILGDEVFTLRSGRYGTAFLDHPEYNSIVSLKTINEEPLRTLEWSLLMDQVSSLAELQAVLSQEDGTPWGLQGLNLLVTSNRGQIGEIGEAVYYALLGRVPRRAGDDDKLRDYAGVLDALDPRNEWTGGVYRLDEMPQSFDPPAGYAANCNVSPAVTDPRIGNDFPLSIIYSSKNLTTLRQRSFETRIESLVDAGPVSLDELLAFATDSRAMHWEMIIDVLLESYRLHGNPLDVIGDEYRYAAGDEIPLGYQLLVNLIYMRNTDGIRADDSHAGALMHAYVRFLTAAGKQAEDREVLELAGGGRPVTFAAFTTRESTRVAMQAFFDTVDWFLDTYDTPPTLKDLLLHAFLDGKGAHTAVGAPGGGDSFRAIGGVDTYDPSGKLQTFSFGGSAFYQLTQIGAPGDVQVHLLKPYTSWNPKDPLGTVMPRRFAAQKFTEVTIPPADADVARRIIR